MKKIIVVIALIFSCLQVKSQEASVEKNLYGVQIGLLSASFQYEKKLSRKIALHFGGGAVLNVYTIKNYNPSVKDETGYITAPFIAVEPRFYYGLDRRARRNKNTSHNNSNFISLNTVYNAMNMEISNSRDYKIAPAISIIPSYGIRRSFAKHFNYEFIFGVGYRYNIFNESEGCSCSHDEVNVDLQAKIGYNF